MIDEIHNTMSITTSPASKKFEEFIISLLRRGDIRDVEKYVDERALQTFMLAFTHKSFDAVNNYELLELIGDVIVNAAVVNYIRQWDKKIVSVKYITRLKHNITSKKELALVAEKAGFFEHIRMSNEMREGFMHMTPEQRHKDLSKFGYMSTLEDTFEGFLGAVQTVIDERSNIDFGIGFMACHRIVASFLRDANAISIRYEDVFDAKTRLKELCDRRKWNFRRDVMRTKKFLKNDQDHYEVTVVGYPYGNRKVEERNALVLSTVILPSELDAQNLASEQALRVLKNRFDIYDVPPNPYKIEN